MRQKSAKAFSRMRKKHFSSHTAASIRLDHSNHDTIFTQSNSNTMAPYMLLYLAESILEQPEDLISLIRCQAVKARTNLEGLLDVQPLAVILQDEFLAAWGVLQRNAVDRARAVDAHAGSRLRVDATQYLSSGQKTCKRCRGECVSCRKHTLHTPQMTAM